MPSPLLEAIDICRRAASSEQLLLNDVSFAIRSGERVALIGPSGAGKTLLLRALAILDPIQHGEVRWRQQPVADADVPRYRGQAMYLGQRGALLEGTVEDNLRAPFLLSIHAQQSYNAARIIAWLRRLGRDEKFLHKQHRQLSGGEAQITALLRALQLDPLVLLADEPTSAMDARTAAAAEAIVLDWLAEPQAQETPAAEARSLVWVSHDEAQSERMATRTVLMEEGRIAGDEQVADGDGIVNNSTEDRS